MGISSSNHSFVILLALLSLTSAYASRALVDNNASKKNEGSLKKTMMVNQKWGGGGGGGGGPTCPGQGSVNCPNQPPSTCPGQGSGNCPRQCPITCPGQGSDNCPGQCQGSCSRCVGYSSGCVQYVPICQIPCGCSQENSGRGYAYGNEKRQKIDEPHGTRVHMVPANGAMTRRTNMINSGVVDNEAHVEKPKTLSEERTQSPSETNNEEMKRRMDTVNSEVHKKAHVQMASTNGVMTHGVDMGNNGEPVKPSMETNGKDGTHGLRETANEVFPPGNENEEH